VNKKFFDKSMLLQVQNAAWTGTDENRGNITPQQPKQSPHEEELGRRLWELFGPRLVYGRQLPVKAFVADPPATIADLVVPYAIFRSNNKQWAAMAVFMVADVSEIDMDLWDFFTSIGIELVPVPPDYISKGYLFSGNFKVRAKKAIYAPTKSAFDPYHKIPSGGWKLPATLSAARRSINASELATANERGSTPEPQGAVRTGSQRNRGPQRKR
jgi:hypothetical protein